MIYCEEAVFIHVPKTGGMSVTRFLVNALDCPVTVFAAAQAEGHARGMAATPEAAAKLTFVVGRRHAVCPVAAQEIEAAGLPLPPRAFSIAREPVDLMMSYYKYMHRPQVWRQRGMEEGNLKGAPKIALESTFDEFVRQVDFYGMTDRDLMRYYRPDRFGRLDIVALPHLNDYLTHRFGHHRAFDLEKMEHRNTTKTVKVEAAASDATRAYIATERYPLLTEVWETALRREWLTE